MIGRVQPAFCRCCWRFGNLLSKDVYLAASRAIGYRRAQARVREGGSFAASLAFPFLFLSPEPAGNDLVPRQCESASPTNISLSPVRHFNTEYRPNDRPGSQRN